MLVKRSLKKYFFLKITSTSTELRIGLLPLLVSQSSGVILRETLFTVFMLQHYWVLRDTHYAAPAGHSQQNGSKIHKHTHNPSRQPLTNKNVIKDTIKAKNRIILIWVLILELTLRNEKWRYTTLKHFKHSVKSAMNCKQWASGKA